MLVWQSSIKTFVGGLSSLSPCTDSQTKRCTVFRRGWELLASFWTKCRTLLVEGTTVVELERIFGMDTLDSFVFFPKPYKAIASSLQYGIKLSGFSENSESFEDCS